MKKFLLLSLITVLAFNFNFLKAEEKLISESFEISELKNVVFGDYSLHTYETQNYLRAIWRITNTSIIPVTFEATLEKISMAESHLLIHCMLGTCTEALSASQVLPSQSSAFPVTIQPGASLNPVFDSYLAMYSGWNSLNATEGKDTFRVTYRNVNNPENDYVTFLCTWDFHLSSIKTVEDISEQIFPNPAKDYLTIDLEENATVRIFTVDGVKLLEENKSKSLSKINFNLPKGTYIISIETVKGVGAAKFIVE
jgi:hypothetical protein